MAILRISLFALLISVSSFASDVPGYKNGRCRILKPDTYDRNGLGCGKGSYAVIYDGFIADPVHACNQSLEAVAQELASSSFCNKLPADGFCTLVYPGVVTASGSFCDKGKWFFSTFDGIDVLDQCYDSVNEAMTKMHESPACTEGKN
jgi:hypothetical protein